MRLVNVVDLMRLQPDSEHPHGLPDAEFDALFTTSRPVIFAYHGYPWLIHRLTYRRRNHDNLHVRGYKEEGTTTTTPFDMVMLNDLDRFHLVMDVIDRVPGLGERAAGLRQQMADERLRHRAYTREHGDDPPDVRDWTWPAADSAACAARVGRQRRVEQPEAVAARRRRRGAWAREIAAPRAVVEHDGRGGGTGRAALAPEVVGHRIVHGGERFRGGGRIDEACVAGLRELRALAPLHQPKSLAGLGGGRARSRRSRRRLLRHRLSRDDAAGGGHLRTPARMA